MPSNINGLYVGDDKIVIASDKKSILFDGTKYTLGSGGTDLSKIQQIGPMTLTIGEASGSNTSTAMLSSTSLSGLAGKKIQLVMSGAMQSMFATPYFTCQSSQIIISDLGDRLSIKYYDNSYLGNPSLFTINALDIDIFSNSNAWNSDSTYIVFKA